LLDGFCNFADSPQNREKQRKGSNDLYGAQKRADRISQQKHQGILHEIADWGELSQ